MSLQVNWQKYPIAASTLLCLASLRKVRVPTAEFCCCKLLFQSNGYFYSSKAFQAWAWAELRSCKLRLIPLQSCSKSPVGSWRAPVSWKVGQRKGCCSERGEALPSRQAALALSWEDAVFIRQPYSQNAEPRHSVWQPRTGMPLSHAFCYASFLWSPLPATEEEIKEKLSSASYLCAPVSFLSFFPLYFWQL